MTYDMLNQKLLITSITCPRCHGEGITYHCVESRSRWEGDDVAECTCSKCGGEGTIHPEMMRPAPSYRSGSSTTVMPSRPKVETEIDESELPF